MIFNSANSHFLESIWTVYIANELFIVSMLKSVLCDVQELHVSENREVEIGICWIVDKPRPGQEALVQWCSLV